MEPITAQSHQTQPQNDLITPDVSQDFSPDQSAQNKSRLFLFTIIGVMVLLLVGLGGYYLGSVNSEDISNSEPIESIPEGSMTDETRGELVACTLEAKICPDGSSVGRIGPDCEFEACPQQASQGEVFFENQQVYINDQYKFQFNYPHDWEVRDLRSLNPDNDKTVFWIGYAPKSVKQDVLGMIEITTRTVDEQIENIKEISALSSVSILIDDNKIVDVDAVPARELTIVNSVSNHKSTTLVFSHHGYTFQITGEASDPVELEGIFNSFRLVK